MCLSSFISQFRFFYEVVNPIHVLSQDRIAISYYYVALQVTHGIHWLPNVDEIYVLKDGRMSEHGTYNSLLTHNGDFAKFLKKYYLNGKTNNEL